MYRLPIQVLPTRFDAFRSIFPAGTVSGAPKIKAIEIIQAYNDLGVSNQCILPKSFIVSLKSNDVLPQVFATEFGAIVFRDQAKDEHEWREWLSWEEEEKYIGDDMELTLKENGTKKACNLRLLTLPRLCRASSVLQSSRILLPMNRQV